jgi:hypothetical protein
VHCHRHGKAHHVGADNGDTDLYEECHEHQFNGNFKPHDDIVAKEQLLTTLMGNAAVQAGSDYRFVHHEAEFIEALRTQRYGRVVMVDLENRIEDCNRGKGNSDGDPNICGQFGAIRISKDAAIELRSVVAAGTGLIWITNSKRNDASWEALAGVDVSNKQIELGRISLDESDISTSGSYGISGDGIQVTATSGTGVGMLADVDGAPAMVYNTYGIGHVVLVTFDPSLLVDQDAAAGILTPVVDYVESQQTSFLAGGLIQIDWGVVSLDPPVNLLFEESLPVAMSFIRVEDGSLVDPQHASWTRLVESESTVFGALVGLPSEPGTYAIIGSLSSVDLGVPFPLLEETVNVSVEDNAASLAA